MLKSFHPRINIYKLKSQARWTFPCVWKSGREHVTCHEPRSERYAVTRYQETHNCNIDAVGTCELSIPLLKWGCKYYDTEAMFLW